MARKTTTFQIEGYEKKFTVNELTVKQIIDILQKDAEDTSLLGLKKQFEMFLPLASNVELADLYEMAPSDIRIIWEKFMDVNKSFFEVSQQIGLDNLLGEMKSALIEDFGKLLVASSKQAMQESLTTGTVSS